MKKVLAFLLCVLMVFPLSACSVLQPEAQEDTGIDLGYEDMLSSISHPQDPVPDPNVYDAFNYLTGEYTLAQDWVGVRPVCVSVNNIGVSWPQSGISKADVIIEMETEYGITRLMCLFADYRGVEKIGSVRSLRDQFIELLFPVDPIILHIGTSIFAEEALRIHNLNTLDGTYVDAAYYRDPSRIGRYDSEHTAMTDSDHIAEAIEDAQIPTESAMTIDAYFNFVAPGETYSPQTGSASAVNFRLSINQEYDGDFRYDAATNQYYKYQRGRAHMDDYYGEQLAFDNVLIVFADFETRKGTYLIEVFYQHGGRGLYFSNGRYEEVTWTKGDYVTPIEFWRADGTPLPINTGKTILCVARTEYYETVDITP